MFSGKTQALIARARYAQEHELRVGVFKPSTDTRIKEAEIRTHAGDRMSATWAAPDGSTLPDGLDVVLIDEAQFFTFEIIPRILGLVSHGVHVYTAGLDLTWKGEPFGVLPALLALANDVVKYTAQCNVCGREATRSYRLVSSNDTLLVGGSDVYEPRCFRCFTGVVGTVR
jgi:thymidine kinase